MPDFFKPKFKDFVSLCFTYFLSSLSKFITHLKNLQEKLAIYGYVFLDYAYRMGILGHDNENSLTVLNPEAGRVRVELYGSGRFSLKL